MANIFIEGFDLYSVGPPNTDSGNPWLVGAGGTAEIEITGTSPTTGTRSLYIPNGSTARRYITRTLPSVGTTLHYGFSVVFDSFGANSGQCGPGIGGASADVTVWVDENGNIEIKRDSTLLQTSSFIATLGVKYYIEATITATSYVVYVDGVSIMSGSMTSIGAFTTFVISRKSSTCSTGTVDDIYLNDDSTSKNNTILGEISVVTMFPTGDSTPNDWTKSTGTTAWEILDNAPPGSAYIEASAASDVMRVTFDALPFTVTDIHVVQTVFRGQKTTAGASEVQVNLGQGASSDSGVSHTLSEGTYDWKRDSFPLDPDTATDWDPDTFAPTLELERTV